MRKEDTLRLDPHALGRLIESQGVKQWWLARMIGVDRKTVGRWLSGKVKRIDRDNATQLAKYLECRIEDFSSRDEADVYATREEQRTAARLVEEKDLLGLLSSSDNWQLAGSLIKATLEPNLPLRELGQLYNLLSITTWRQGHYEEGARHAQRAREIGEQLEEKSLIFKACFNLATIDSLQSRHRSSLELYTRCIESPQYFESRRDHGSTHFNIGMVYRDFARFPESLAAIDEAIRIFEPEALDFNLAIAWVGRGTVETELGLLDRARQSLERARHHADQGKVPRYQVATDLYLGEVLCLEGRLTEARPLILQGFEGLTRFPVHDLACHEIMTRFHRRAGDLAAAVAAYENGLEATRDFPTHRALLLQEGSRLAASAGDPTEQTRRAQEANDLLDGMELGRRAIAPPIPEYGACFNPPRTRSSRSP